MRAVVTGGAGFLGSHLVDKLVGKGWEVVAVDNLITGSWENLAHLGDKVVRIEQDVSEHLAIDGPVDFVFHFASPASPVDFTRIPIKVLKAGSLGTHNALGLAMAKKAKFMFASTSEVYGDPLVSPQPETYWGNVNPIGPRGVYDEAKRFGEAMTMAYHNQHGVDTRIVRFFNTYGPRMRLDDGRVVPNFVKQALLGEPITIYGDGLQTRSFGFYEDIVEGVWRLANADFNQPVNIGTDQERTMLEFARAVLQATGSKSPIIHVEAAIDDPRQRRPDLTRARTLLGWEAKTSLDDGLAKTVEYFRGKLEPIRR
ncbi:MAG TPA: UDP-glucuronic acid decarboxylase family protein [Fimbriimonadaceae bacterium]|nr:UDP-glucuronic acid decarboxylase family protein [Fimbriimonadaceae bacterium]